jgi:hypothetical protein
MKDKRKESKYQRASYRSSSMDELNQKKMFSDLAGYIPLKYVIPRKPLITPEPEVGKSLN